MENDLEKAGVSGEVMRFVPEQGRPCEEKCSPCPKFIEVDSLARAYVPIQKMCEIYPSEKGLRRGTIYPELDKPYDPDDKRRCRRHNEKHPIFF